MGGFVSDAWDETKRLTGHIVDPFESKRKKEYDRGEDKVTGKDEEKEAKQAATDAAGLARSKKSKSSALKRGSEFAETGEPVRKSLLKKTGRRSTKVVGRKTLGGRSLL